MKKNLPTQVLQEGKTDLSKFLRYGRTSRKLILKLTLSLIISLIFTLRVNAQVEKVTGTVIDERGQSLPEVSVTIKGTTVGTMTDSKGKFALNIPDNKVSLVF